jgi:3',5'-cyclic-AMP phosphodiesterase
MKQKEGQAVNALSKNEGKAPVSSKVRRIYTISVMLLVCILAVITADGGIAAQEAETPQLTFAVLSDLHVRKSDITSRKKMAAALEDLQQAAPRLDTLVFNGDLGNGLRSDYETFRGVLEKHPHPPVLLNIGNHEFYHAWYNRYESWSANNFPNGETEMSSVERFLRFSGEEKVYHDRWIGGYHFICLGTERYRQTEWKNGEDAYLSQEQLDWLKLKLEEKNGIQSGGKNPIFVFLHQPLPNTVTGTALTAENRGVIQHEALRKLFASHPEIILFSGHTHFELKTKRNFIHEEFAMVGSSSVYDPRNEKDQPLHGRSEGLVVSVFKDGSVQIKGRAFESHQWVQGADYRIRPGIREPRIE